jgi:hypothetical protein
VKHVAEKEIYFFQEKKTAKRNVYDLFGASQHLR